MKKIEEASIAVAEAVKLCRAEVIPIYPITPQTHNAEALSELVANGELDAAIINVESEHSAMSAAIGASAAGSRTYTATSSQGLKYMSELLFVASGMRFPIVMMVANRSLSAPLNIWNDHSDSMAERDSGWMQIYVETAQEAVDRTIQSFKIAESCLIPVMVCMDGFVLTHSYENVDIPEQKEVDAFLPKINLPFVLNPEKPVTMGSVASPGYYMEIKKEQHENMLLAMEKIKKIENEFTLKFKREYSVIEEYYLEDAEKIIICMGTVCGTAKEVIDKARKKGKKYGLLKISLFRPFPRKEILDAVNKCKNLKNVIVVDRAISTGNSGVLFSEIKDTLFGVNISVGGYIAGLGGRDVTEKHILKAFNLEEDKWLT